MSIHTYAGPSAPAWDSAVAMQKAGFTQKARCSAFVCSGPDGLNRDFGIEPRDDAQLTLEHSAASLFDVQSFPQFVVKASRGREAKDNTN